MKIKDSFSRKTFLLLNVIILGMLSIACILPFIHILAVSLSKNSSAMAGLVTLWPINVTAYAYEYVLNRAEFWNSMLVSIERVFLGGFVNMLLTVMLAYPLAKESQQFKWRTAYAWFFVVTMLFNGGLIPTYAVVRSVGLMDTLWSLILPGAVPVFNVVLMLNFFRQLPRELEEAAYIDGASHMRILWKIFVPVSMPAIATIALFCVVGHWNSWFDGLIYMNRPWHYPLQSYLQTVIIGTDFAKKSPEEWKYLSEISDRTLKTAQIIIATIPILIVYPFLQRYFVTGIVLGSVKG